MKIIKFSLFIISMLFIVFLANFLQFNKQRAAKDNGNTATFTPTTIVHYEYGDIKSLASIYFNTKQEILSKFLNIDIENIQNTIVKKDIKIENIEAELIVFIGLHRIEQITVLVEPKSNTDIERIVSEIKNSVSLNVPPEVEEIDDKDGNVVGIITTYNATKYDFIITQYYNSLESGFTIDLRNNIYSY